MSSVFLQILDLLLGCPLLEYMHATASSWHAPVCVCSINLLAMPTQSLSMLFGFADDVVSTVMCVCCAGALTSLTWSNAAFNLPSPVLAPVATADTTSPLPDQVCSAAYQFISHILVCFSALTHCQYHLSSLLGTAVALDSC